MNKRRFLVTVCLLALLPLVATAAKQASAKDMSIGVSLDNLNDPFWQGIMKGMQAASKDLGVQLVVRTAEGDAVKQNNQIDDLIAQGVSALDVVYVDNKSIVEAVKAANKANVPFVYCDRTLSSQPDAKVAWGIATDNYALTVSGWKWMADYAHAKNLHLKVLELVGSLSDENVLRRTEGFKDVMKASDNIELVQQVPTEWNLEKALAGTRNALQAHPEINTVFMHSDYLLGAVISALRQAGEYKKIGEPGHVIVMPYSGNKESLGAMKDGYVEMTFGMDVFKEGYELVKAAVEIAKGNKSYGEPILDPGFIISQDNLKDTYKRAYGSF